MKYIKANWIHENPEYPVWLYSELDEALWEIRKIEVYADGAWGFASETEETGGAMLSLERFPSINDIAADPQFDPAEIEAREFEEMWIRRLEHPRKVGPSNIT